MERVKDRSIEELAANEEAMRSSTCATKSTMMTSNEQQQLKISFRDVPESLSLPIRDVIQDYRDFMTFEQLDSEEERETSGIHWWIIWFRGSSFEGETSLERGELICEMEHDLHQTTCRKTHVVISVYYASVTEALRSLGKLLGARIEVLTRQTNPERVLHFREKCNFTTIGLMLDCSRNAVMRVPRIKELIRKCALMGLNSLQLYTEDTYEILGEPFFGYLRGKFTQKELRDLDEYAHLFGIEMFPCIQTLGHLGQMLQWPRYQELRDTSEVLLALDDRTYEFIEKMIKSVSSCFRSKKIHLGMDEAYGLGEGRFRQLIGSKDRLEIFVQHLRRVHDVCLANGLQPLMWSDMLFCLASNNTSLNGYYESTTDDIDGALLTEIPRELVPVYWDYFHVDQEIYLERIEQHRNLDRKDLWVAGGLWTWNRFWAASRFSLLAIKGCMNACKTKGLGIQHTFVTIWGDDGNECDTWSCLPGLLYYAEHCYREEMEIDRDLLNSSFTGICRGNFDDWVNASKIDEVIQKERSSDEAKWKLYYPSNMSKWLLWEDPLYSHLSPETTHLNLETHYQELERELGVAANRNPSLYPANKRLEFVNQLCRVLRLKLGLRPRLRDLLVMRRSKDDELRTFIDTDLEHLKSHIKSLWRMHRDLWFSMNQPFGWEVIELRYGGLLIRLESLGERLTSYISHETSDPLDVPEILTDLVRIHETSECLPILAYSQAATPSRNLGSG